MNKKSFILYIDQSEIFKALTDEQAGKLIKAIFEYNNGFDPKLDPTLSLVFIPIKQTLNRDTKKWDNIVKRNKENIKKRYLPKPTKSTTGRTGIPNPLDSDNDSDNDIYKSKSFNKNISYLENIPLEDVTEFTKRFNITAPQVKSKAEDLINYCKAKGKTYSDYKAFLSNALKKDYGIKLENVSSLGYKKYEKSN